MSLNWMAKGVPTVCELCEQLGYRWAVCSACGIEFPYQAADQLAALKTGRMDGEGGWPWFVVFVKHHVLEGALQGLLPVGQCDHYVLTHGQEVHQQMHFDVGEAAVLDLGATKHDYQWPRPNWTPSVGSPCPRSSSCTTTTPTVPRCTT
jgi:hypothetical protein